MVMYRNNIPLIPQDELAYSLGLVVPEEDVHLFMNARTALKPSSGWGTQISKPEYNPNKVFKELSIPLAFEMSQMKDFIDIAGLKKLLISIQADDGDALLCFDYGKLWSLPRKGGHVCVFDRIEDNTVHLVDPASKSS